jgi:hypothetical protein
VIMGVKTEQLRTDLLTYLGQVADLEHEARSAVAVYVAMAHVAPLRVFPVVPYLDIRGASGAGKSTLGRALASLAGGKVSSGRSPAAMFHWLDAHVGILYVLDEGEAVLRGIRKQDFQEILLEGNWRGGTIERARSGGTKNIKLELIKDLLQQKHKSSRRRTAKDKTTRRYRIFGPKVLVSISGVDPSALERRTIPIDMEEAPLVFVSRRNRKQEKVLRRNFERWAKEHRDQVRVQYKAHQNGLDYINQAHRELWAPMRAVADVLGVDVSEFCKAHGAVLKQRAALTLRDALGRELQALPRGRHHFTDLRKRLQNINGARADLWNEERIGHALRRMGYRQQIGKDGQGKYLDWQPGRGQPAVTV